MTIVGIGEILWDVFPDSERLGGACLNFAAHVRRLGHRVAFLSAAGDDERGRSARARMGELGLDCDFLQTAPGLPTGTVTIYLDPEGRPDFTIHRPAAYDAVRVGEAELARLAALRPDWICFGTLHQMDAGARAATRRLMEAFPDARRFYDVNLRRDCYTPELLAELLPLAHAVKVNEEEAVELDCMFGYRHDSLKEFTARWSRKLKWSAVAVTRGARGCLVRVGGDLAEAAGHSIAVADTVGAGDAFAAGFVHGLSQQWPAARVADFANRLGAVVASRPGGVPPWSPADLSAL